jgi:transglutaminase-like putative cysteine protease
MKKNTWYVIGSGILVLVMIFSGCNMFFPATTYESQPTRIQYDISYGYRINCTGTGRYEISYLCDTPEVLLGTATYTLLYNSKYETKTMANNTFIRWNISANEDQTFILGVAAQVNIQGFLVSDLNGVDALTVQEIHENYPTIVQQFTHVQANETIRFIDPENPEIQAIARMTHDMAATNNSFLLAKSLFAWLKGNIQYQTHPDESGVQPAMVTLQKKTGDCDDLSFLYVTLCRAAGIPARFIRGYLLTENSNGAADATTHAWTEVFVGGSVGTNGWVPVECACVTTLVQTDINQNFGLENAFHLRLFIDDGSNESLALSLSSISYITFGENRDIELQPFAEIQNYQVLESKKLTVTSDNTRLYE